jgi:hypothetical protein
MAQTERNLQAPMEDGFPRGALENAGPDENLDGSAWLLLARQAFEGSEDFINSNLRRQWERNYYSWRSHHAPGSKYNTDAYKNRSKAFRPKTRSTVLREEAKNAAAHFSTEDVVSMTAENDNDPSQQASAAFWEEQMKYRLNESVPWFLTVQGAYQTARVTGITFAHIYWLYEERVISTPALNEYGEKMVDVDGNIIMEEAVEIVRDKPVVELRPPENLRIDAAADWTDPIGTSPFIIDMVPMYVTNVRDRMEKNDPKTGAPQWIPLTDAQISSSMRHDWDATRQAREGNERVDSKDTPSAIREFELVWIHRNIIRKNGVDWYYETLSTDFMLTEPVPLDEVYLHGVRPYVAGYTSIEAFRPFPAGLPELTEGLQVLANEHSNLRIDNVRLALLRRYIAERNKNTDIRALTRGSPGGVTMTDKLDGVKELQFNDVTQSAYQEQDRINLDYDELSGSFSSASVATNRSLNETVGGMQILSNDSNQVHEYTLRIFSETFVKPVLKQLLLLSQEYETDAVVMALAGDKAKLVQRFGVNEVTDELLRAKLTLNVNVGIGATNPTARVEKLLTALTSIGKVKPGLMQRLDDEELVSEVFGALGYQDGKRFFAGMLDAEGQHEIKERDQIIAKLTQIIESKQVEEKAKAEATVRVAEINASSRVKAAEVGTQGQIQAETIRSKSSQSSDRAKNLLERTKLKQKDGVDQGTLEINRARLRLDAMGRTLDGNRHLWEKEKDGLDRNGTPEIVDGREQIKAAQEEFRQANASVALQRQRLEARAAQAEEQTGRVQNQLSQVLESLSLINAKLDAELGEKDVERDEDGKIIRVGTREVIRGKDGLVVGLGEAEVV